MKRRICFILLLFILLPVNTAFAQGGMGTLIYNINTNEGKLNIEEEYDCNNYSSLSSFKRGIYSFGDEKLVINSVIVVDDMGERELKKANSENIKGENYLVTEENTKDDIHVHSINFNIKEPKRVKKIKLNYNFENPTSFGTRGDYSYLIRVITSGYDGNDFKTALIHMGMEVEGLWTNNDKYTLNEEEKGKSFIINEPNNYGFVVLKYDKNEDFLKGGKEGYNKVLLDLDSTRNNKIFGEGDFSIPNSIYIYRYKIIFTILIIVGCIFLLGKLRNYRIKEMKKIEKEKKVYGNELRIQSYSEYEKSKNEPFKMPKQISPAYVGVLFNSTVGDIIYTITLELIRRGVIKVVKAPEYKGIKENGVYRKFTFRLTEAEVILK
ncbi:MAG: hypothetical protein ACRC2K_13450, partial [Clostridium sp.]